MAGYLSQKRAGGLHRLGTAIFKEIVAVSKLPHEMHLPSPWRCCRLQVMAFLLLTLLGSCVHSGPATPVDANQPSLTEVTTPE